MSDRDFWFDRVNFIQRIPTGIDPTTRLEKFSVTLVLSDEPCDLFLRNRRVAQQTVSGTVYNVIETPYLKVYPDDETTVPDENDEIVVNGSRYRILQRQDYRDPASNSYRGTLLTLERPHSTDST